MTCFITILSQLVYAMSQNCCNFVLAEFTFKTGTSADNDVENLFVRKHMTTFD